MGSLLGTSSSPNSPRAAHSGANADRQGYQKFDKKTYWLVGLVLLLLAFGQVFTKLGSQQIDLNSLSLHRFFNRLIILGLLCLFLRGFIWILAIRHLNLSFAYPLLSLSFIIILLLSSIVFHERITVGKFLGSLLIIAGVFVNSLGEQETQNKH